MSNKSQAIVKQASILALAGILVRIIGVLYRSPLTSLIGDEGNGYYSTAYNIYSMVLLISSYSIPTAISKLMSEKIVVHEYDNAKKIFKYAILYVIVIGGSAALLAFILAPYIVTDGAVLALRILCPTIFFSGLVGVLRGYFQAHQTTLFTSISQIIEQIFNAVVSILAAYLFIQQFGTTDTLKASYGAGGSALGTGAGVFTALIFLFFVYLRKANTIIDHEDPSSHVDSGKVIIKSILNIVTPIIIATCVYNLVSVIDMSIFYFAMGLKNIDSVTVAKLYGVYAGKFVVLMNLPVALASAMSTASIPAISAAHAIGDTKELKSAIDSSISITMLILIPSAVGLAVLSYPIMGVLFPQKETIKLASMTLTIGAGATVFYGLSTISNGILQAIGAVKVPLNNAIKALIVHVILITLVLVAIPKSWVGISTYFLAMGTTLYALQMCITNQLALRRIVHYKYHVRKLFLIPIISSAIMGVICFISYQLLFMLTRRVFLPLVLSIIIGVIVYFAMILFFYKGHEEELNNIPYMNKILRKLHRI